jgi:anti-sigma-K factor RskA
MRFARAAGPAAAAAATLALALGVAAAIKHPPARFAAPPIAVVRDGGQALWAIRLAPSAHEIAVDRLAPPVSVSGDADQLWLATPAGPRSLGLLPRSGREVIPEIPTLVTTLTGSGELLVSREPPGGSRQTRPSGSIILRAAFRGR